MTLRQLQSGGGNANRSARIANLLDDLQHAAKHRDWRTIHTLAGILLDYGAHKEVFALADQFTDLRPLIERLSQQRSKGQDGSR